MAARDTRREALSIGEFARRSGLSYKALRLYDLSGLLPPASVDPVTGYRWYAPEQLTRARRIGLLRQLDMPLAAVTELLAGGGDDAREQLDRWWAGQEAAMRERRGSYEYLRADLLRGGEGPPAAYPVRTRTVAATKVASVWREVDQQSLVTTMLSEQDEIWRHLRDSGATPTGETWWIFHGHVTPDGEAPVEACVPFTGTVEPAGAIAIRWEPEHTEAYCQITRDECVYPRIMAVYDRLEAWVAGSGRVPAGDVREVYLPGVAGATEGEPFAYVAQPVSGSRS